MSRIVLDESPSDVITSMFDGIIFLERQSVAPLT